MEQLSIKGAQPSAAEIQPKKRTECIEGETHSLQQVLGFVGEHLGRVLDLEHQIAVLLCQHKQEPAAKVRIAHMQHWAGQLDPP